MNFGLPRTDGAVVVVAVDRGGERSLLFTDWVTTSKCESRIKPYLSESLDFVAVCCSPVTCEARSVKIPPLLSKVRVASLSDLGLVSIAPSQWNSKSRCLC